MKHNSTSIFPLTSVFIALILISISFRGYAQINSWQHKASLSSNPRFLATGFGIGQKGYVGMGFNYYVDFKDFWEYDPATDTWSQKADFGGGNRHATASFVINNKGYVGTGSNLSASDQSDDFWEYDPANNVWTRKADFPGGARTVAQGFAIGNKGYLGLGRTGNFGILYNDFWEYDATADTWTRKADFAGGGRYATSGFAIGTNGYIGTGTDFTGGGFTFRTDFWGYNQLTNQWTRKSDFAGGARELAVGLSINSEGYIGTGSGSNDFWEYDPSIDRWTSRATFAGGGRNMATSFTIGGHGYLGFGVGSSPQNDLWEYSPLTQLPPTITPPPDITVATNSGCMATNVAVGTPATSASCGIASVTNDLGSGNFPLGVTTVTWTVTDNCGKTATATQKVTVTDNTAPVISNVFSSPNSIWPPNHKMVAVTVNYTVSDNCGLNPTRITVSSNEPQSAGGDWVIIDNHHVQLRADRLGSGSGRFYTINITATDQSGNSSFNQVTITVPHDQGAGSARLANSNDDLPGPNSPFTLRALANPAHGFFSIRLSSSRANGVHLSVRDILGRSVENKDNVSANSTIYIGQSYRPGLYFVEAIQGREKVVLQLIKL